MLPCVKDKNGKKDDTRNLLSTKTVPYVKAYRGKHVVNLKRHISLSNIDYVANAIYLKV